MPQKADLLFWSCVFLSLILLYGRAFLPRHHDGVEPKGRSKPVEIREEKVANQTNLRLPNVRSTDLQVNKIAQRFLTSIKESAPTADGIAACLLIRDENHQLAEWLAYHYLVLPLRHLVVAIDPTSLTSPEEILKRWTEPSEDGFQPISLVLWNDGDYYDGEEVGGHPLYLDRQNRFIRSCAQYHKEMNRTWVIMTDPDEFITFNTLKETDPNFTDATVGKFDLLGMKKYRPGIYRKFFDDAIDHSKQELKQHRPDMWRKRTQKRRARKAQHFSFLGHDRTLLDVINQDPWVSDTCVRIPRVLFSPIDSPKDIVSKSDADAYGLNPMKFRTLRFFHHDRRTPAWRGKVILDVSRTPKSVLSVVPESVHSPFTNCGWVIPRYEESIFRIHHYLGTWEEYSYKRDCRKTEEKFESWSSTSVETNYDLQPWLTLFMDTVGMSRGKYLLQGAGDIPVINLTDTKCFEAA